MSTAQKQSAQLQDWDHINRRKSQDTSKGPHDNLGKGFPIASAYTYGKCRSVSWGVIRLMIALKPPAYFTAESVLNAASLVNFIRFIPGDFTSS